MVAPVSELIETAEKLKAQIDVSDGQQRVSLHQQFHSVLGQIRMVGGAVPAQLLQLDFDLTEEEVEDGFDNMPV